MSGGERAWLAHGDLDVTHIYQRDGRYTGIIDFGEIRGADRRYDLGHFHLHDGETLAGLVLPDLLAGYREVAPLPPEAERQIRLLGLLIGLRALRGSLRRPPGATGGGWAGGSRTCSRVSRDDGRLPPVLRVEASAGQ